MQKFKETRKTCMFRESQICSYWSRETQCHFVACPLFSYKLSNQEKHAIKKRINDSIVFHVDDFDKAKTTALDLIQEVRTNELELKTNSMYQTKKASVIRKSVQRMICIVCGEIIMDDKFSTIRDPNGVIIYIHSKGKCEARKEQILATREKWLKTHTPDN